MIFHPGVDIGAAIGEGVTGAAVGAVVTGAAEGD